MTEIPVDLNEKTRIDEIRKTKIRERQRKYRETHSEKNAEQNRKDARTYFNKVREDVEKYEEFKKKQKNMKSVSYFIKQLDTLIEKYKEFENNERVNEITNIGLLKFIGGDNNKKKISVTSIE
jgi:chromatin segregation and condensation protein Rec8/ScpA/Scc1 (kleisin family)